MGPPSYALDVLFPRPLKVCTYLSSEPLPRGTFVSAPLRGRSLVGVVWSPCVTPPQVALKAIDHPLALSPLAREVCDFVDWVAGYYLFPPGEVLKMVISARGKTKSWYTLASPVPPMRRTPLRERVIARLQERRCWSLSAVREATGLSAAQFKRLCALGVVVPSTPSPLPPLVASLTLTKEQERACQQLEGQEGVTLIDGVTGSGKTELYFQRLAQCTGQVLVLLPEIALLSPWMERFRNTFGSVASLWHSSLSKKDKSHTWDDVLEGRARVLVGTRSALFLPFRSLSLIIVDEEHASSFKQEEGLRYHARDMAVVRGQCARCPVMLASATPSLETCVNVAQKKYNVVHLPSRFAHASLPTVRLVDRRSVPSGRWVSPSLQKALGDTLERGEQGLLFLNRRGYAPLSLCRGCGFRLTCPSCSAWLVEHRFEEKLLCHFCGYKRRFPDQCPGCDKPADFIACGPGVERLEEEVRALFPHARLVLATSDTLSTQEKAEAFLADMGDRKIDLVIGTQLIAKGYHFPYLTCVGVVDADMGLAGGDLRAAERTYQLLHQVAGRAGRAARPGYVFVQTSSPPSALLRALERWEREEFMEAEGELRRQGAWPPFGRLASLIVSGRVQEQVHETALLLSQRAPHAAHVTVFGPAPAPLLVLRDRYRYRLLIKGALNVSLQKFLTSWLSRVRPPAGVRILHDIDPYTFL